MNKFFSHLPYIVLASVVCASCSGGGAGNAGNRGPNANDANAIKVIQTNANTNRADPNANTVSSNKTAVVPAMSSPTPLPAPDNSTVKSEMLRDGTAREVREFKDDPTIIKVERRISSQKDRYFVYLRNGKVVEAPADKMKDYRIFAPANILEIIGVKPPSPAATNAGPQTAKPKQ